MHDPGVDALRALLRVTGCLPWPVLRGIGRSMAALAWLMRSRSARDTRRNLELCFPQMSVPERDRLARRSLAHTAMLACELGRVWFGSRAGVERSILRIDGVGLFTQAREQGRAVLVLAPHLGNWEILVQQLAKLGPATVLYRQPRQAALAALSLEGRSRLGTRMASATRSGIAQLLRSLQAGEIVCVLPDQQPRSSGAVFSEFFGVPALTPTLVHGLLRRTGCACVMGWCERLPRGFALHFTPVDGALHDADPQLGATALNRALERCVRAVPEQYQWEYRRFSRRPPGSPKLYESSRRHTR